MDSASAQVVSEGNTVEKLEDKPCSGGEDKGGEQKQAEQETGQEKEKEVEEMVEKETEEVAKAETSPVESPLKGRESSGSIPGETRKRLSLISTGSPIPDSYQQKKPPLENFAVGMSELIYFENLPTSTGAFDKMRSLLSGIRKKLSD
jgi:hypothetical protein